jgi:hypothetical protein
MKNIMLMLMLSLFNLLSAQLTYPVVDTNQFLYYGNTSEIAEPAAGEAFFGQDAHYSGYQPCYSDNGDGTITDIVTGLMWQKTTDHNADGNIDYDDKMSHSEALANAENCNTGGYNDWRLPNIKELYSLILFSGIDPSGYEGTSTENLVPFIDTDYFEFAYGDQAAGERIIDAQYATSTLYIGTTMNDDETMFGVNFADGRIKGYPTCPMPGQQEDKQFYVLYVRGNNDYAVNDFTNNANGTISDNATGLMWSLADSGEGMTWEDALSYAENASLAGYDDWRLPNVKELQSIVDYSEAPSVTGNPAINGIFECSSIISEAGTSDYPYYWSSTTHVNWNENNNAAYASYVSFGTAFGYMGHWIDVHGAGAQRSDPKSGDPDDYPQGHGPQGDAIRIYNFVRLVRDANLSHQQDGSLPSTSKSVLLQNFPNPFNPGTTFSYSLSIDAFVEIDVYNLKGRLIDRINLGNCKSGEHSLRWEANELPSGVYLYALKVDGRLRSLKKCILMK